MIYFIVFLLPLSLIAKSFELPTEEVDPETEEILLNKPEKYLLHESMVYNFDSNLGIKEQRTYTGSDRNKVSISGHLSGNYEHLNQLLGGEISYQRRTVSYDQLWWGARFFQYQTKFGNITQNHPTSSVPNSEGNIQRDNNSKNNVTGIGLGLAYRFKLLLDFYRTEDVFEMIEVFVNNIQMNDDWIKKSYQGYVLSTSFGLHKRSGSSSFYGAKYTYHIGTATRAAISNESAKDRSFALGWSSIAFEFGIFY